MRGRYGGNEWKLKAVSVIGGILIVGAIGGVIYGGYTILKPKFEQYEAEKELEEQAKLEEQAMLEEQAALEEQAYQEELARQEEARLQEEAQKVYISQYEVVVSDANWLDAKAAAEDRGGHLAVITSEEEQRTVEALIDQYDFLHTVWLGGMAAGGTITWVNSEEVTYTQWGPGEPNNETGDEIYLDMYEKDDNWYWNDVPNDIKQYYSGKMGYVIEWEVEQ